MRRSHLEPKAVTGSSGKADAIDEDEEEALLGGSPGGKVETPQNLREFLRNLEYHFGFKLLATLFASQHALKGFAMTFVQPCVQYLLASYQVNGPQVQVFQGVISLPWAMKPVIGLVSDAVPIFGYKKGPYMILVTLLGIMAYATIGSVPKEMLSLRAVVACLFFVQLQCSACDLLSEALYAAKIQVTPKRGPALMTYVWFGIQVGAVLAGLLVGPAIEHYGVKVPFLIALGPASCVLVPIIRGYLEEQQISREDLAAIRRRLWEQGEVCFLSLVMSVGTLTLSFVGIAKHDVRLNAAVSLVVAIVALLSFSFLLRPEIAKVNAFFLIQTSATFQVSGASFYFYTDTKDQFEHGPGFSVRFYASALPTAGAVFSLVGIFLYQRHASEWKYRSLLIVSNMLVAMLSLSDTILFAGINRRYGIPDEFFVLGASVLTDMVKQWQFIPGIVIISQVCPKGMEAIMYSLLAGCHNLGSTVATTGGAFVLELLECRPSGRPNETDEFKNLWLASAISVVLPVATVLLIPWLIPDAKQTDRLIKDGEHRAATQGSLFRRLMGWDAPDV